MSTILRDIAPGKLILTIVVAIALACGLCPGLASASQLAAGQGATQGDQALSTQAATKTVYVITGTKEVTNGNFKSVTTTKYTYKNGLLTKRASSNSIDGKSTASYTYKGTTLKSSKQKSNNYNATTTYTFKKGLNTKAVRVSDSDVKVKQTYTGTYKSGLLAKKVCNEVLQMEGNTTTSKDTYTYTYKKGRVATRSLNGYKLAYGYDANGNLNNIGGSAYKNAYNAKKLLAKTTFSEEGYSYAKTYTYKAVKVSAAVAAQVEAQQWAIINNNLNFAFGIAES